MNARTKTAVVIAVVGSGLAAAILLRKPAVSDWKPDPTPNPANLVLRDDSPGQQPMVIRPEPAASGRVPPSISLDGPRSDSGTWDEDVPPPPELGPAFAAMPRTELPVLPDEPKPDTGNEPNSVTGDEPESAAGDATAPNEDREPSPNQNDRPDRHEPARPVGPGAATERTAAPIRVQRHAIVDGDTLAELARRYLNAPEKAEEIFQFNRDVLTSRQLLPIGRTIRIPIPNAAPADASAGPRSESDGRPTLVPIPHRLLRPAGAGR